MSDQKTDQQHNAENSFDGIEFSMLFILIGLFFLGFFGKKQFEVPKYPTVTPTP